ncbi:MAG: tellurium resistance protein TerY, partial [Deltaproteobacteria bacterium]|nr:tellurium resistance protein TerY [Deltaproteobacteria bacterium]
MHCLDNEVKPKSADHPGDWKPLIFLLTDGEPTDEWRGPVRDFRNRSSAKPANLIAIGCGPNVNTNTLREISETVVLMQDMTPERIRALFQWISQSAKVASKSASTQATAGAAAAGATLPPPPPGIQIAL